MASEKMKWSFGMTFLLSMLGLLGEVLFMVIDYKNFVASSLCAFLALFFLGANLYKNFMLSQLRLFGLTEDEIKELGNMPQKRIENEGKI